jgi:hypothetical protein
MASSRLWRRRARAANPGATANTESLLLLTCDGQMRAVSRNVSEQGSLALTIDLDVGKVRIGSWGSTPITNKEGDAVTFGR